MAIQVTDVKVYSHLSADPEEQRAGITYTREGTLSQRELVDRSIEDSEYRRGLDDDAGSISICIAPGDELGELSVNLQFEGKSGQHAVNLQRQGDLIDQAGDWLRDILEQLNLDYRVQIEAQPCPNTDQRLPLARVVAKLQGHADVVAPHATTSATTVEEQVGSQVDAGRTVGRR